MAMFSFATFFRSSDSKEPKVADVRFHLTHSEMFLTEHKTDQLRCSRIIVILRGKTAACLVTLLERLIHEVPLTPDQPPCPGI